MGRIFLQRMVENLRFEELPPNWNSFDIENFSKNKKLWDYQQSAVKNAVKALWKYYEDFVDYQDNERLEANAERKRKFYDWYQKNGLNENLDIKLDKRRRDIYNLLTEYYPQVNGKIPYEHFINRMCFWMATGSGKSLVIIKLIQILSQLIKRKEIPPHDILVLTHRDDLIEQLKRHVEEFNRANEPRIILRELKEYPEAKRSPQLFDITVFYYRSDNLSDQHKEKIIDFRNYDNNGRWYIFLDEAHKGDKEDSKRQHIYSILSRNGFLFNSSATFTDPRDIITCVFEFNLSSFINSGYGKHIAILKQEIRAFRNEEDYTNEEKQKIVLKSLILLTYVKKFYEKIKSVQPNLYHRPLLLTLVNSVNTQDADLKLFFRELVRIGKGEVEQEVFNSAIDELWEELKQEPEFMFEEGEKIKVEETVFKSITLQDILNYVYNSEASGEIEVLRRRSNTKELAFKLKTSERPFALIKIGDISEWLKNELSGYEIQERFEDESYFENLNREESEINILMGSRGFYEGWDSNRPNVINFINIGMGEEAKKFILQSVGRGIRIEPIKDKRKRLLNLYNGKEIPEDLFNKIKDKVLPIETLFIFGTNRNALITVVQELDKERKREGGAQLTLFKNDEVQKYKLLVPTYKLAEQPLVKNKEIVKFELSENDFNLLKKFLEFIPDDRILLMRYTTEPWKLQLLRESLEDKNNFKIGGKSFKNVDLLIQRYFDYFNIIPEEFKGLKELEEEIRHFKNIKVHLRDITELQNKIDAVKDYPYKLRELESLYGEISPQKYIEKIQSLKKQEEFKHEHKKIKIKYVTNHYYIPLIFSEDEKIDYIQHIIKTQSEVRFIEDLEKYLEEKDNKFQEFDWWMFSKLDETLDEVYIPYYNPNVNQISRFYPDFIFWLEKGDNYFIVFVDPKGTEYTNAYRKIDGYKELFEDKNGKVKNFSYNGKKVKIKLFLRSQDVSKALDEYKYYWFDNIQNMLEKILLEFNL